MESVETPMGEKWLLILLNLHRYKIFLVQFNLNTTAKSFTDVYSFPSLVFNNYLLINDNIKQMVLEITGT